MEKKNGEEKRNGRPLDKEKKNEPRAKSHKKMG
jgi:hypothetical protein